MGNVKSITYNLSLLPINQFNYGIRNRPSEINVRKSVYKVLTKEIEIPYNLEKERGIALLDSFFNEGEGQLAKCPISKLECADFEIKSNLLNHDVVLPNGIKKRLQDDFIEVLSCYVEYGENDTIHLKLDTELANTLLINPFELETVLDSVIEIIDLYNTVCNGTIREGKICSAYISKKMLELDKGYEPLTYVWQFSKQINLLYKDSEIIELIGKQKVSIFRGAFSLIQHKLITTLINVAERLGNVLYDYEGRLKENRIDDKEVFSIGLTYDKNKGFLPSANDNLLADSLSHWLKEPSYLFERHLMNNGFDMLTYRVEYSPCDLKIVGHYASKEPIRNTY